MGTKKPLLIFITVLFSAAVFVLAAVSYGQRYALATTAEDEIKCEALITGRNFNVQEGASYKISCSNYTEKLSYVFDPEYKDAEEGELELTYNSVNGRKEVTLTARENGWYEFTAHIKRNDEEYVTEYTLNVSVIDYMSPSLKVDDEKLEMEGGRFVAYWIKVSDYYTLQKRTASSGLNDIGVFVSTGRVAYQDLNLPSKITLADLEQNENFTLIKKWPDLSQSGYKITYDLYDKFDISQDGFYYIFTEDRVGNTSLTKMFDINQQARYELLIDGYPVNCSELINTAAVQVSQGAGTYNQELLETLESAANKLLYYFQAEKSEDEKRVAHRELRAAMQRYTNAKAEYQLVVENAEIFPGEIKLTNFNATILPALKGDVSTVTVKIVEYRDGNNMTPYADAADIFGVNRVYKLEYSLTKNGEPVSLTAPLEFYITIPAAFEKISVVSLAGGEYKKEVSAKGPEWLTFSTSYSNKVFGIAVVDNQLEKGSMLWLIILISSLAFTGAVTTAIILIWKKKKASKPKTTLLEEESIPQKSKPKSKSNKSKKGGKKKK